MANEVRLIDANALDHELQKVVKEYKSNGAYEALCRLRSAPTIDPESLRPKGHWVIHCLSSYDSWTQETDENFYLECSECKRQVWDIDQMAAMNEDIRKLTEKYPYCHCGAKMVED